MRSWQQAVRHRLATAILCLVAAAPARAITIVPTFDASITGAGNAATIEGAIGLAINTIDGLYADVGTIGIYFATSANVFGESNTGLLGLSYAGYVAALSADAAANPQNTVLQSALAHLASGNDSNGALPIAASTALLRVGLGVAGTTPCFSAGGTFLPGCGGVNDGVVTIGTGLNYSGQTATANSQAVSVLEHEINEVLGAGGIGSMLGSSLAGRYFGVTDLYRYHSFTADCSGITSAPSFTTSTSEVACYSINGGLSALVQMNQNGIGDYGDFTGTLDIQNWAYPGTTSVYSTASPEYTMMLSIGYDPIPEPAGIALLGGALVGFGMMRRQVSVRQSSAHYR